MNSSSRLFICGSHGIPLSLMLTYCWGISNSSRDWEKWASSINDFMCYSCAASKYLKFRDQKRRTRKLFRAINKQRNFGDQVDTFAIIISEHATTSKIMLDSALIIISTRFHVVARHTSPTLFLQFSVHCGIIPVSRVRNFQLLFHFVRNELITWSPL